MKTRVPALAALAIAAAASLGAGSGTEHLTQGAWAKLLLDRMGLAKDLSASATDQSIGLLAGRAAAVEKSGSTAQLSQSDGLQKTWKYDVTTPTAGTWLLVTRNDAPAFVSVDKVSAPLTPSTPNGAPSDVGRFPLLAGNHTIQIHVARNVSAPDVTLVAGCSVVAPPGGWSENAPLTWGLLARTLVQATRQLGRLPANEALSILSANDRTLTLSVEREGTYTILLSGHAFDRASYRLDGCEEVRPLVTQTADGWREGSTVTLTPGEHPLTFFGMDSARGDGRVRLVRRASSDSDQLAVLAGMGVKLPALTASIEPRPKKEPATERGTGGVRHAAGDPLAGLGNRIVTREEADQVLATPGIAHRLAHGRVMESKRQKVAHRQETDEFETFETPISPTVPGGPDAE